LIINIYNGNIKEYTVYFLAGIYNTINPTLDELEGFKEALLDICIQIYFRDYNSVDIVGTGGDYKNTFNISTISSFIVAGAGYYVIKNGNYNYSSSIGYSNIIKSLGYSYTYNIIDLKKKLNKAGICFINASKFNKIYEKISQFRSKIGLKTFFNIIGPLLNPAKQRKKIIGVNNLNLARLYNYYYLLNNELNNFTIISSLDGYDEISLTVPFQYYSNINGEKKYFPKYLNKITTRKEYLCNYPADNKQQFLNIISGNGLFHQNEIVLTNAAFALELLNGDSFENNYNISKYSLKSGLALNYLDKLLNI
jgi:anthranilate phosphoribosyltransferase